MMDNVREKLVELLREVQYLGGLEEKLADHLIANGVTIIPTADEYAKMVGAKTATVSKYTPPKGE